MEIMPAMVVGITWKFKGLNGNRMVMEIILEMEISLMYTYMYVCMSSSYRAVYFSLVQFSAAGVVCCDICSCVNAF